MRGYDWPGFSKLNLWKQDKGQYNSVRVFVEAIKAGKESPMSFGEMIEVAEASFNAVETG